MATAVPNSSVITLQPTGPVSPTSLNPFFTVCDPLNGNYFVASGRDLVTFFSNPPSGTWNATVVYTAGQVILAPAGSPPVSTAYIAIANSTQNINQNPATSPAFWAAYTSSTVTIFSAPDACTGRKADVDDYAVPVPQSGGIVSFQILPSSVFTQTTGYVQFLASSNLVQVNVSSL